jgi:hypothetical protein
MPVLVRFAQQLNTPLESRDFSEFLAAADHDRHPGLQEMTLEMRGGKLWNPFSNAATREVPCASLGEMLAKATEDAIKVGAVAVAVCSPSGRIATFRVRKKKGAKKRS